MILCQETTCLKRPYSGLPVVGLLIQVWLYTLFLDKKDISILSMIRTCYLVKWLHCSVLRWFCLLHPLWTSPGHSLSQQGVWVSFGYPNSQRSPYWTPKRCEEFLKICEEFCKMSIWSTYLNNFHLNIIPITLYKDIMPYFDELILIYSRNMSILWFPLKIWTPKMFTIANFEHPCSKSWLRPCPQGVLRASPGGPPCVPWGSSGSSWHGPHDKLIKVHAEVSLIHVFQGAQVIEGVFIICGGESGFLEENAQTVIASLLHRGRRLGIRTRRDQVGLRRSIVGDFANLVLDLVDLREKWERKLSNGRENCKMGEKIVKWERKL